MLTLTDVLSQACSNPSSAFPGENEYRIDTHCVAFIITGHFDGDEFVSVDVKTLSM
jgi:hypothetical protein